MSEISTLGKLLLGILGKKTLIPQTSSSNNTTTTEVNTSNNNNICDTIQQQQQQQHINVKDKEDTTIKTKLKSNKFVDDSIPTDYERKKLYSNFKKTLSLKTNDENEKEMLLKEFFESTSQFYTNININQDIKDLIKIKPIQFLELKQREIDRILNTFSNEPLFKNKLLNLIDSLLIPFENEFLKNIEEIYPKLWFYNKTKKFIISNKIMIYNKISEESFNEFGEYVEYLVYVSKTQEYDNELIKEFKKDINFKNQTIELPKRNKVIKNPPTLIESDQFFLLMFVVYQIQNSSLFSIGKLNFKCIIKNTIQYIYNDKDLIEFIQIGGLKEEEKQVVQQPKEEEIEEEKDNYKKLINKLLNNRNEFIILCGTGISIGLAESYISILTWKGLVDSISQEYSSMNNEDTLLKKLEEMISNNEISLVEAVDLLKDNSDSKGLSYKQMVYKILNSAQPTIFSNPSHSIAECIRSLSIPIITTNYDHLLETCLNRQSFDCSNRKIKNFNDDHIYHVHGSMDNINEICLSHDEYTLSTPHFITVSSQWRNKSILILGVGDGLFDNHWLPFLQHSKSNHFWVCSKESLSLKGNRQSLLDKNMIVNVSTVEYNRLNSFSFSNFLWKLVFDSGVEQITFSNTTTINNTTKSFNLLLSWDSKNSILKTNDPSLINENLKNINSPFIQQSFDKSYHYENVYIKRYNEIITNNFYKKTKSIKVLFFTYDESIIDITSIAGGVNLWVLEKVEFTKKEKLVTSVCGKNSILMVVYEFEIHLPVGKNFYQFSLRDKTTGKNQLKLIIDQPTGKYLIDQKKPDDRHLTKNIIDSQSSPLPIELKFIM